MTPDSQKDFFNLVLDPGKKRAKTPPQEPKASAPETPPEEPLISGGPTKEDFRARVHREYTYATTPSSGAEGVEHKQFAWETAIDDLYPVEIMPEGSVTEGGEDFSKEPRERQKRLTVRERLRAVFQSIPASSPLWKLTERILLQHYQTFRESPSAHPDPLSSTFTDALLETISYLDAEEEIENSLLAFPKNTGAPKESTRTMTLLHTLPVERRIKTQHALQPLFAGFLGTLPLDEQELALIKELNELQLFLFERVAERLAQQSHPLVHDYPLKVFLKLAEADGTPTHIHPECRGALASAYPIWWDPHHSFGWHPLYRFVEDNGISADVVSPAMQAEALFSHRITGRKRAIESGQQNRMPADIAKFAGRAVETLLLEPHKETRDSSALTQLRALLEPFHSISRDIADLYTDHLSRRRLLGLFEKGGICRPLVNQTARIMADAYVRTYADQNRLTPPVATNGLPLLSLLEQILKNDSTQEFASRFMELFPDHLSEWLTPPGSPNESSYKNLVSRSTEWFLSEHYGDVLRFTMFLLILARLLNGEQAPRPQGTIIPQVRLQYDTKTNELKVCDGIILPQSCDPAKISNRTIESIRAAYPDAPLSIIEVKTIISLYRFPNPPRAVRMHDLPQVESYVYMLKEQDPSIQLDHVFLYYVTLGGMRLLAYTIGKDKTLQYDHAATVNLETKRT